MILILRFNLIDLTLIIICLVIFILQLLYVVVHKNIIGIGQNNFINNNKFWDFFYNVFGFNWTKVLKLKIFLVSPFTSI